MKRVSPLKKMSHAEISMLLQNSSLLMFNVRNYNNVEFLLTVSDAMVNYVIEISVSGQKGATCRDSVMRKFFATLPAKDNRIVVLITSR